MLLVLALGAMVAVALVLPGRATAADPRGVVLVDSYSGVDLGATRSVTVSTPDLDQVGFDDRTSALRVRGDTAIAAYSGPGYTGTCETFVGVDVDLRDNAIGDNTISSVKIGHTCTEYVPGKVVLKHMTIARGLTPSSARCPDGYTKKLTNLNEGTDGLFLYACLAWGARWRGSFYPYDLMVANNPIDADARESCLTYDDVPNGRTIVGTLVHDAERINGDLNEGASTTYFHNYMYFCLSHVEPQREVMSHIRDIDFIVSDEDLIPFFGDPQEAIGDVCKDKMGTDDARGAPDDLNHSVGGKFIYACWSYSRRVPYAQGDTTPPTITLESIAPAASADGWHRAPVKVTWRCTDAESGVVRDLMTWQLSSEGRDQEAFGRCQDEAGNVSTDTVTVDIDGTAPEIARVSRLPAANAAGWNREPVTVTWSCTDALSGVAGPTVSVTLSGEGAGQSATGRCEDRAGNVATDTVGDVNIDLTAPLVTWTGVQSSYGVLDTVRATCTATDALSGIATTTCRDASAPAWSFGPGRSSLTATATDRADNTTSATAVFEVTATTGDLCTLTRRFLAATAPTPARARPLGVSLCRKLRRVGTARTAGARSAAVRSYVHEVRAATPRWFTAAQGATLRRFALAL